ncbi:probable Bax inhibitor 1 isoform X1 [Hydra vulgaris]|nr:probable Bax inhibitor 1 [Hydra vulgaris]
MDALFGQRPISLKALTDFSNLDSHAKKHLKNVYACLTLSTIVAGVGAFVDIYTNFLASVSGLVSLFGSIGFLLAVAWTENKPKNQLQRLGYLMGFSFCVGLSLGPLIGHVIKINPTIVATALFSTSLIFLCFSLSALWAEQRSYLYLGGTLLSALSLMCLLSFINIFFKSEMIYQFHLYGGLLLFCAFILYDTQLIVEKRRMGDTDFIWHSVDLFLDFVNIFRRLLIILGNKEEKKKNKRSE